MNKALFERMMAQLGQGSMLPPPKADYAPGGAMFAINQPTPEQQAKIDAYQPTSTLGKLGKAISPQTAATMAGKGGGA